MLKSGYHLYSSAYVAATKKPDEDTINVIPIEHLTDVDGSIDTYVGSLDQTMVLEATWINIGCDGRLTSPDVVLGEVVWVYRYADTDKYYWVTIHKDSTIRKLEHVVYGWCDTADDLTEAKLEDMYTLTASTRDQYIELVTSKKNKEPVLYTVRLDTKEGVLTVKDDVDNTIVLRSTDRSLDVITSTITFTCDKFHVTGDVQFDKTLTTDGATALKSTLAVSGSTTIGGSLNVSGSIKGSSVSNSSTTLST